VQARRGVQFPDGRGLLAKLKGLNAWCKVTVLRLETCGLGEGGGQALAEALRLNATVTSLNLWNNGLGEGGGRALAEALRLNATVTPLDLHDNALGEGGGRALAEALRLNTTLTCLFYGRAHRPRCLAQRNGPARGQHLEVDLWRQLYTESVLELETRPFRVALGLI
jgi:hypothetical protein